eukprot:TRINITY_DN70984_c0_g1_i1.p1 TRINITY_DN70984_c0_g1~~TRINITY_DN70984_c0_g1_i1.p1  ORF type:complete len:525 (-),score=64.21 TRINITY_DN70984_c0_g1_i1:87-1661(-)
MGTSGSSEAPPPAGRERKQSNDVTTPWLERPAFQRSPSSRFGSFVLGKRAGSSSLLRSTSASLPTIHRPLSIPEHQGWLYMATSGALSITYWDKRWVELHGGFVQKAYVFETPDGMPLVQLDITGCWVEDHPSEPFAFTLHGPRLPEPVHFAGDGDRRKDGWWKEFIAAINGYTKQSSTVPLVASPWANITLTDFELLKVIGKGAFGKVIKARLRSTGVVYAVKSMVKTAVIEKGLVSRTISESTLHRSLHHPFIVRLHTTFQTPDRLFLVLDFLPAGHLGYYIANHSPFPEGVARFYLAQLVLAIDYLHSRHVVHLDIKPDNIMMGQNGYLVLSDFGLARKLEPAEELHGYLGVVKYAAPELVLTQPYNYPVDIWALGVVFYRMMIGFMPFEAEDNEKVKELIVEQPLWLPPEGDETYKFGRRARDVLARLLDKSPRTRITAAELREHPFLRMIHWERMHAQQEKPPFSPDMKGWDSKYVSGKYMEMAVEFSAHERVDDTVFDEFCAGDKLACCSSSSQLVPS